MVAEQTAALEAMQEAMAKMEEKMKMLENKQEEIKEEVELDITMMKSKMEKIEETTSNILEKEVSLMDGLQLKFAQMENDAQDKHMEHMRDLNKIVQEAGLEFNKRDTTTATMIAELQKQVHRDRPEDAASTRRRRRPWP